MAPAIGEKSWRGISSWEELDRALLGNNSNVSPADTVEWIQSVIDYARSVKKKNALGESTMNTLMQILGGNGDIPEQSRKLDSGGYNKVCDIVLEMVKDGWTFKGQSLTPLAVGLKSDNGNIKKEGIIGVLEKMAFFGYVLPGAAITAVGTYLGDSVRAARIRQRIRENRLAEETGKKIYRSRRLERLDEDTIKKPRDPSGNIDKLC
ncbi:MAG: hypothetical protein V1744_06285 [Candidatus Altiarchaeota archaeon]